MRYDDILSAPELIRNFLTYQANIKNKSKQSISEYYADLTTFFRYIKLARGLSESDMEFSDISIDDIDDRLVSSVTLTDIHDFLAFCNTKRENNAATRARKASTLRIYFRYLLNNTNVIHDDPTKFLETPKIPKNLPKHLTLSESVKLLDNIDGNNKERDYCIITLFLNCGMRLSELCNIDITDIRDDNSMVITGKGNKQRTVYLNQACVDAIAAYLPHRHAEGLSAKDKNALFVSRNNNRLSNKSVQHIVYKRLQEAGLGDLGLSVHKLRHTAATLMYQHGQVDIRVLQDLLGHVNLGTTQIYTHVADENVQKAISANPLANIKVKK